LPLTDLLPLAHRLAGEAAVVTHSGAPFVEIAASGITKARALADLCADLGIVPGDVIAFGDMPNDLPMLSWAGYRVAVANAHPDILAIAHEITATNNEDGVARSLVRFMGDRARTADGNGKGTDPSLRSG
jgi:hydroxymethylpyrimidine pyrophosphatase-like HAD family hydrolase